MKLFINALSLFWVSFLFFRSIDRFFKFSDVFLNIHLEYFRSMIFPFKIFWINFEIYSKFMINKKNLLAVYTIPLDIYFEM